MTTRKSGRTRTLYTRSAAYRVRAVPLADRPTKTGVASTPGRPRQSNHTPSRLHPSGYFIYYILFASPTPRPVCRVNSIPTLRARVVNSTNIHRALSRWYSCIVRCTYLVVLCKQKYTGCIIVLLTTQVPTVYKK